jgi:hypothetical protein
MAYEVVKDFAEELAILDFLELVRGPTTTLVENSW